MDKYVARDRTLKSLFKEDHADYVLAPNENGEGSRNASKAKRHGDFDDDVQTVKATLVRILDRKSIKTALRFPHSPGAARDRRSRLA